MVARLLVSASLLLWVAGDPIRAQVREAEDASVPDLRTRTVGLDWPAILGAQRNGKSIERSLLLSWPPEGPPLRWQRPIGEGYSMPSVARGRLFVFDRHANRARLTCRHSETGAELWRAEYVTDYEDLYGFSNGPRASPVVEGAYVYTFGAEGRLRCHRVVDGAVVWDIDTSKRFGVVQNFFGVGSTPIVEGDLLIVLVGGSPPGSPDIRSGRVQSADSGIVAFDRRTGEVRYMIGDALASYSSPVIRSIRDRRWGFVFSREGLVAFEPTTGRVDFRFPWRARKVESVNAANPVVVADTVFITESYGPGAALLRVKPGGYEVLRQDDPGRKGSLLSHWSTPIHHQGYLYGCSGSGSGDAELRAVNYRTGEIAWRKPGLGRSTLLFVDDHFVVLTEYGELLVVRATPERYEQVSRVKLVGSAGPDGHAAPLLKHPAWSPPVLSHGLLYVRGKDRLVVLDLFNP